MSEKKWSIWPAEHELNHNPTLKKLREDQQRKQAEADARADRGEDAWRTFLQALAFNLDLEVEDLAFLSQYGQRADEALQLLIAGLENHPDYTIEEALRAVWDQAGDDVSREMIHEMQRALHQRFPRASSERKMRRDVRGDLRAEGKLKGPHRRGKGDVQRDFSQYRLEIEGEGPPEDEAADPFAGRSLWEED